jgi:hypothetical protein
MRGLSVRIRAGIVTIVLVIGALALAVIAIPLAQYGQISSSGQADSREAVSVLSQPADLATSSSISLTWSDRLVMRSASSGVVSAVFAHTNEEIGCGEPAFEVAAAPVVAYCGPRPLTSAVSASSSGADATEFVAWMLSIVGADGPDELLGAERQAAIADWQTSVGQEADGIVDPGDLLWIRTPSVPSSIEVSPGEVIGVGDSVFTVEPQLTSATVAVAESITAALPTSGSGSSPFLFDLDGLASRLEVDRSGVIQEPHQLEIELRQAGLIGEPPPDSVTGTIRLAVPIDLLAIPVSAVVPGSPSPCVVSVANDRRRTVPVTPRSSSLGSVLVEADLANGSFVLVAPDRSTLC